MPVERLVNTIGKQIFMEHYEDFRDLSMNEMQDLLEREKGYARGGTARRYGSAQQLFRDTDDLREAMRIIANANIPTKARQKARRILDELE